MLKKIVSTLALASAIGLASAPVAMADECYDRCYQNCMKFGNGDTFCAWTCQSEVCLAPTINGIEVPNL